MEAFSNFLSSRRTCSGTVLLHIFLKKAMTSDDIRTVQELLGHRSLQTTMIYTHVATKNILGIRSPLDK